MALGGTAARAQQMPGVSGPGLGDGGMGGSFDPRINLRAQAERMLGTAPPRDDPNQRAWSLDGAVTLEERLMKPGLASTGGKAPDLELMSSLSPSVVLSGKTQRVTVNLNYRPQAQFYLENKKQNRIDQNLTGNAQATIIPETFFVDTRALTTVQSRLGNQAPQGLSTINKQDTIQTSNFSTAKCFDPTLTVPAPRMHISTMDELRMPTATSSPGLMTWMCTDIPGE